MTILNMTMHAASEEQLEAGVVNPSREDSVQIHELLTFKGLPSEKEVEDRALALSKIALGYSTEHLARELSAVYSSGQNNQPHFHSAKEVEALLGMKVMIGGAPYLMGPLSKALKSMGMKPMFAFSERVSKEDPETGVKTSIFKHLGFVPG